MKRLWALVCVWVVAAGAWAQSSPSAFDQVTTPFSNAQPLALGGSLASAAQCGALGDYNGDGYGDYAAFGAAGSDGTTMLQVYLGTAEGVPGSIGSTVLPGFSCGASQPVAADVNGDGLADLLVLEPTAVLVLLSRGDGTFAQPVSVPYPAVITSFGGVDAPTASLPGVVVAADVNGDGFADLVVSDNAGQVLWYQGRGDGSFATPATLVAAMTTGASQSFFGSIVSGDLNGDGIADLAVCAPGSNAACRGYVFLGSAAGPVAPKSGVTRFPPTDEPIAMADLNGDGHPDLLLVPTSGAATGLLFAAGDGVGGFLAPVNAGAAGQQLQVAGYGFVLDLNGDGRPDLVFEQAGMSGLAWAAGAGDGTFRAAAVFASPSSAVLEQAGYLAPGKPVAIDTAGTLYEPAVGANAYVLGAWFVDFGSVAAGSVGPAQTVSVAAQLGSGFAVESVQAAVPVSEANTCSGSPNNCTVTVAIAPTRGAPYAGSVTLATNIGQVKVPVFANETAASPVSALRFVPGSVTFAAQPVLTASTASTLTLTNTGTAPVALSGFALSGDEASDFTQTTTCGSSLAAGAGCSIAVVFTPQAAGTATATLTATDATGLSRSAALTGTGVFAASFSASPAQVAFGQVRVGNTSEPQTITLTNTSPQTATLASATLAASGGGESGDFGVNTGGCVAAVAPGASCTVSVTFAPVDAQTVNATLALTDQNGKATDVGLTGTGYLSNPNAAVNPTALVFAPQVLYTTSAPQTVTITNTGMQALSISFVGISGSFTQTGSCPSVAAGASCSINVTFTASILGPVSGSLTITDNSGLGLQTVTLSGTGIPAPAPQIVVGPATLTFPDTLANAVSAPQTVTVTNTGTAVSNISSVTVTGPFAVTSGCGNTLAPNTSCAIGVAFAPTVEGAATGTLTIVDDANGSPQTIPLAGNGTTVSVAAGSGSTTTQTVTAGSPATYTLTVAPQNGFVGTLLVSCTGAPSGYQCTPSVPSVVLNGQTGANVTFTVQSTQQSRGGEWPGLPGDGDSALPALAFPLLAYAGRRRRPEVSRGRCLAVGMLGLVACGAMAAALMLAGCSGTQSAAVAPVTTPVTTPTVTQQSYTLLATFTSPSGTSISQPLTLVVNTPAQ